MAAVAVSTCTTVTVPPVTSAQAVFKPQVEKQQKSKAQKAGQSGQVTGCWLIIQLDACWLRRFSSQWKQSCLWPDQFARRKQVQERQKQGTRRSLVQGACITQFNHPLPSCTYNITANDFENILPGSPSAGPVVFVASHPASDVLDYVSQQPVTQVKLSHESADESHFAMRVGKGQTDPPPIATDDWQQITRRLQLTTRLLQEDSSRARAANLVP